MDVQTAKETIYRLENAPSLSKEDAFLLVESYQYVIEQTGDPEMMLYLGGYYYGEKNFVLAKKYYEMSASLGDVNAYGPMGYIFTMGGLETPITRKPIIGIKKRPKVGTSRRS
jgi:TPR repeat protein